MFLNVFQQKTHLCSLAGCISSAILRMVMYWLMVSRACEKRFCQNWLWCIHVHLVKYNARNQRDIFTINNIINSKHLLAFPWSVMWHIWNINKKIHSFLLFTTWSMSCHLWRPSEASMIVVYPCSRKHTKQVSWVVRFFSNFSGRNPHHGLYGNLITLYFTGREKSRLATS